GPDVCLNMGPEIQDWVPARLAIGSPFIVIYKAAFWRPCNVSVRSVSGEETWGAANRAPGAVIRSAATNKFGNGHLDTPTWERDIRTKNTSEAERLGSTDRIQSGSGLIFRERFIGSS